MKEKQNGNMIKMIFFEEMQRLDKFKPLYSAAATGVYEKNIREGAKLEKAGCFVIYGVSKYKTHIQMPKPTRP